MKKMLCVLILASVTAGPAVMKFDGDPKPICDPADPKCQQPPSPTAVVHAGK